MAELATGSKAPDLTLPTVQGGEFQLRQAIAGGEVLAAFFKVACPTCQLTFPYLERIHKAYGAAFRIVGISQDSSQQTKEFMDDYGVTFPVALDDTRRYPASNAYKLTNVPSMFLIARDGTVQRAFVGWTRTEIDELNRHAAKAAGKPVAEIFRPGEQVPEFKAG